MKNYETDKQVAADSIQVAANEERLNRWLQTTHPEIPTGTATVNAFKEYFEHAFTLPLNPEDFAFALDNMSTKIMKQHVLTKDELIDRICKLLRSPDGTGKGGRRSDFDVATARSQMNQWSLPQLQARLDQVIRTQSLAARPVSELKEIVQSARPSHQHPPLPRATPEGTPIDAAFLRRLPTWELKTFIRRHGERTINARLRGE